MPGLMRTVRAPSNGRAGPGLQRLANHVPLVRSRCAVTKEVEVDVAAEQHARIVTTGFFRPEYFYAKGFTIGKRYAGLVKELSPDEND